MKRSANTIRELFGQSVPAAAKADAKGSTQILEQTARVRAKKRLTSMKRTDSAGIVKVGLMQTTCSADPAANLKKTLAAAERAAKQGAKIICTQELFRSQYFCQSEDHGFFKLAESIPGPTTDVFQKLAKKHQVVVIASVLKNARREFITTRRRFIDADGSLLGHIARCTFPTIRCSMKNFILRPATSAFARGRRSTLRSAC